MKDYETDDEINRQLHKMYVESCSQLKLMYDTHVTVLMIHCLLVCNYSKLVPTITGGIILE